MSIPPLSREPCEGADLPPPPNPTEADWQVFGRLQTGQLDICDRKRALAVAAGDLSNLYGERLTDALRPPEGWERVFGKHQSKPPKPTLEELLAGPEVKP
ncbi:MAG: hypothetical protein Q8R82_19355 [Hyphomonadaceae bacterium]|nr:hypothetical protein [Hyphomonadaceae bacterium]